jgi:ribosomal protein RSM22 (predicted rRNA methylase)
LITSSYANEFIYISAKGREALCAQTQSSRIILIRPSNFLTESVQEMKEFLYPYYSRLFLLEKTEAGKIIVLADSSSANYLVLHEDENYLIRDVKDISKKDYFRQLVLKRCPNEIESEMRIFNIPEKDSKFSTYTTVKTHKNFKNKKEKSCVDTMLVIPQFMKIACSALHYLDCSNWEQKPLEILIIGGSTGTLPFFLKNIYHKYVNITIIEKNDKLKEIGEEYFGHKNLEAKWEYYSNPMSYLQSMYDKRTSTKGKLFDMIVVNENNFGAGQTVSPQPDLVSKKTLQMIKVSLYRFIYISYIYNKS